MVASGSVASIPPTTINYLSQVCDKAFHTLIQMNVHIMVHSWEKQFEKHMTHAGEQLFHCTSCDRYFSRSDSLKTHQLTHRRGVKPCSCV